MRGFLGEDLLYKITLWRTPESKLIDIFTYNFMTKNKLESDKKWVLKALAKKENQIYSSGQLGQQELKGGLVPSTTINKELIANFFAYKKSDLAEISIDQRFSVLIDGLKNSTIESIKFHCGTPKTGSSSLQSTLYKMKDQLNGMSILYPDAIKNDTEPKHQKLVTAMKNDDFEALVTYLGEVIEQARLNQSKHVIISTEGIFNHWQDFSLAIKTVFRAISQQVLVQFILVLRDPVEFLYSMYLQNLKNVQRSHPVCYGQDWSFETMLEDPWFINHLDYLGFILSSEALIGKGQVELFLYNRNIVSDVIEHLGMKISEEAVLTKNVTSKKVIISDLRRLNRRNLTAIAKAEAMAELKATKSNQRKEGPSQMASQNINQLFCIQKQVLQDYYGFSFD